MNYKSQSNKPEWYDSDDSKIYFSATSGSSPFNEWYEFDDREEALKLISETFHSQSFVDRFTWFEGEVYEYEAFTEESVKNADSGDDYILGEGAEPADIGEMIGAESRF